MMEEIKFNRRSLVAYNNGTGQATIRFRSNLAVGRVPLLKVLPHVRGTDLFGIVGGYPSQLSVAKHNSYLNFGTNYSHVSFRSNLRDYRSPSSRNPSRTIIITMLSMLGVRENLETLPSDIAFRKLGIIGDYVITRKYQDILVTNPIDVFILAVIDPITYSKLDIGDKSRTLNIDPTKITLLISQEKFADKRFFNNNYNSSVRREIQRTFENTVERFQLRTEIVPDEVLQQYYYNPFAKKINSVFEIMELDKIVKDKTFTNIGEHLLVREMLDK